MLCVAIAVATTTTTIFNKKDIENYIDSTLTVNSNQTVLRKRADCPAKDHYCP